MKVLWSSMLLGRPLDERIEAAARAGYDALSVGPDDLTELGAGGRSPTAVARSARDAGVDLAIYDAVVEWYDHDPSRRSMWGTGVATRDILPACAELGVTLLNAVAPYPSASPLDEIASRFAALADQVAELGAVATLEFTPYPPVGSLATGWEVVRLADRPNAKLLVDTWHIVRSGSDAALLREIPGDRIGAVQVSDGDAELTMPLMKATVGARRLPGEGDFDLATMRALRDNGGLTCVGPEVMTVDWVGMSTVEVAQTAFSACERVGAW